jgi:hypothetical protein
MSISYYLRKNTLTEEPDDYRAYVSATNTVELESLINWMIERGSTVTRADILSVFEDFNAALEFMLNEGYNVNTPFANFRSGMKGVFMSNTDVFDSSRHQIGSRISAGKRLRDYYRKRIETTKLESAPMNPNLLEFIDHTSAKNNSTATPGGMATLTGHRLKYDPEDENQGVFFIAGDGTETKVTVIGQNTASKLSFDVPKDLTIGEYQLVVRNNLEGALDTELNVS